MKVSTKTTLQTLLCAAPLVVGSTLSIAPSQAATFAGAGARLTLQNFTPLGDPDSLFVDAETRTTAIVRSSTAEAFAPVEQNFALSTPEILDQSSLVLAFGDGASYLATGESTSQTGAKFSSERGSLKFNFQAELVAIATTDTPDEQATAKSIAAFYIFDSNQNHPLDFLEVSWLGQGTPTIKSQSDRIRFTEDPKFDPNTFTFSGYYEGKFEPGTQFFIRSFTRTEVLVAAGNVESVPEPSMMAAFVVLPGLLGWKRRAISQEAKHH